MGLLFLRKSIMHLVWAFVKKTGYLRGYIGAAGLTLNAARPAESSIMHGLEASVSVWLCCL